MKIKNMMLMFTILMVTLIGIATVLQEISARKITDQAVLAQQALVKTSILMDDVRLMQIEFKWQVQVFKDVVLRGAEPELLEKYTGEYESHYAKTHEEIEKIAPQLAASEYAPIAAKFKDIQEQHEAISKLYRDALVTYKSLVSGPKVAFDIKESVDKGVRGIDRQLTADTNDVAVFVRAMNVKNAETVTREAGESQKDMTLMVFAIGIIICVLAIITGLLITKMVLRALGAEPGELSEAMKQISAGNLTSRLDLSEGDESSCAANLSLMQMKVRTLVVGIKNETEGALERIKNDARIEHAVNDIRALNKSIRKFKVSASEVIPE